MRPSLLPTKPPLPQVVAALQARPEPIYLAGGYVRDWLLGKASNDLDFAVDGEAIPLARRIADDWGGHYVLLDAERDTGRVVFKRRGEVYYVDLARLRGNNIQEDLMARDFTMNAIAVEVRQMHLPSPPLLDPLGGEADISKKIVRATSERAFRDDPLRMLRAVRQAATLDFHIAPETEQLIRRDAPLIERSSGERVRDELTQLLAVRRAADHLRQLAELGLLGHILPEVAALRQVELRPEGNAYELALRAVEALEGLVSGDGDELSEALAPCAEHLAAHLAQVLSDTRERKELLKLAALLHNIACTQAADKETAAARSAEMAADVLRRLRFSGREITLIETVIRYHPWPICLSRQESSPRVRYRFFKRLGDDGLDVLLLALAVAKASGLAARDPEGWRRLLRTGADLLRYYAEQWPLVNALPPLLDGNALIAELGLRPGRLVGELLDALREAQAVGEIATREEALAWARRELERRRAAS